MQITFDTDTATPAELSALARFVQDLAALATAPDAVTAKTPAHVGGFATVKPAIVVPQAEVVVNAPPVPIAPADQPDAGAPPVDDQQAAAVFGQQRIDAAPPSVAGIPTVPAAPSAAASTASATVPPATAAAPSAGVELDSKGLPWDARIHAANRSRNQDGSWRQRRGLNDEALRKRVEDELRAALALPAATVPTPPAAPVGPKPWENTTEQYLAGAPTPPAPPAAVVPPAPATFGEFMAAASNLVAQGKLAADTVTVKLQGMGLATVMALASRPDLIPDAWAALHS